MVDRTISSEIHKEIYQVYNYNKKQEFDNMFDRALSNIDKLLDNMNK